MNFQRLIDAPQKKPFPMRPARNLAVFDVDRTFIDRTAWHYACLTPDLLMSEADVTAYTQDCQSRFEPPHALPDEEFRSRTLERISATPTRTLNALARQDRFWGQLFEPSSTFGAHHMAFAGHHASGMVQPYEDATEVVAFMQRLYGASLELVFLTSGYRDFIAGLLQGILWRFDLQLPKYRVVGSELSYELNGPKETFHMSQYGKQVWIEEASRSDARVRFLADDSSENPALFAACEASGGVALHIKHDPVERGRKCWSKATERIQPTHLENVLREQFRVPPVSQNVRSGFAHILAEHSNKIGIPLLPKPAFDAALSELALDPPANRAVLDLVFVDMNRTPNVSLRGTGYYPWLPVAISRDARPYDVKWLEHAKASCKAVKAVFQSASVKPWCSLTVHQQLITFSLLDNLFGSMCSALNTLDFAEVMSGEDNSLACEIEAYALDVASAILECLEPDASVLPGVRLPAPETLNNIARALAQCPNRKGGGMRELDDVSAVVDFIGQLEIDLPAQPETVIFFPCGATDAGILMRAFAKSKGRPTSFIPCYFSTKKKLRGETPATKKTDLPELTNYVPKRYRNEMEKLYCGGKEILLVDNNFCTLGTVHSVARTLTVFENRVFSGVVAGDFANAARYLANEGPHEPLVQDWQRVLAVTCVKDYVTAFNTWGSAEKHTLLSDLFDRRSKPHNVKTQSRPDRPRSNQGIFKVCRVHNRVDLDVVLSGGANFVGIHAVDGNRLAYLEQSLQRRPQKPPQGLSSDLPVPLYEISGIRDMVQSMPGDVGRALVVENLLPPAQLRDLFELYGLDIRWDTVQLQHRLTAEYVAALREMEIGPIIAALGFHQADFRQSAAFLAQTLNPERDHILVDFSHHQPDMITADGANDLEYSGALAQQRARILASQPMQILLANDGTPQQMRTLVDIMQGEGASIAGVDMQNALEIPKEQQLFAMLENDVQVLMRKCPDKTALWSGWSM